MPHLSQRAAQAQLLVCVRKLVVAAANISSKSFLLALAFFAFTRFHIDGIARCQIEKQPPNTKNRPAPFLSIFYFEVLVTFENASWLPAPPNTDHNFLW